MEHNLISGFHHIGLKCSNIEKTISMYTALGCREVLRWGEGEDLVVMLDIGDGGRIELFANGSEAYSPKGKWIHFALKTPDVEAAYARALNLGFTSKMPPAILPLASSPVPTSIHIAFVYGPDGEQIEFFKEV